MEEDIQKGEVVLYQPNETVRLEVRLENETVWLTQQQIADLFDKKQPAISRHIKNIYAEGELKEDSTYSILEYMGNDGKQVYSTKYYNLDMILSIGYRCSGSRATQFRQWASSVLKQYLLKGYSVNHQIVALQERVDNRLMTIEKRLAKHDEQIELYIKTNSLPQEQLFQNGCMFDAWTYVSSLITSAKQEIILVDNYAHESVLALFAKRADGVTATIHTRYTMKFTTDLRKFNEQYPDKAVKYIQLSQKNHDRFLIIDNDVYLLGASLKDLGDTWGAIIKMNETKKANILNNLS